MLKSFDSGEALPFGSNHLEKEVAARVAKGHPDGARMGAAKTKSSVQQWQLSGEARAPTTQCMNLLPLQVTGPANPKSKQSLYTPFRCWAEHAINAALETKQQVVDRQCSQARSEDFLSFELCWLPTSCRPCPSFGQKARAKRKAW